MNRLQEAMRRVLQAIMAKVLKRYKDQLRDLWYEALYTYKKTHVECVDSDGKWVDALPQCKVAVREEGIVVRLLDDQGLTLPELRAALIDSVRQFYNHDRGNALVYGRLLAAIASVGRWWR